eukprot:COSAG02_NODE_55724_length_289_cov_0.605263_1_plen_31_part_01
MLLGRVLRPLVIHSRPGFLSNVIQKAMKNLV